MAGGLLEPLDVSLPHLPAGLIGARIAHLSDLHITRPRRRHRAIVTALANQRLDMVVLTGDYMNHPGDEAIACQVLEQMVGQIRPRLGFWGVFGNHDTLELIDRLSSLPVTWLRDQVADVQGWPLRLMGLHTDRWHQADTLTLIEQAADPISRDPDRLTVALGHYPTMLPVAADLGADLLLAGHTHGGQCRLPTGHALINSCDLPLRLTSGMLRHQETLGLVSRGLGEVSLPLRVFCRPHVPIYTLRRGPMPGEHTQDIRNVWPW